ncbi:MAG TPA: hypothetical protein VIT44_00880 [Cyclobacteriaceae bacterium]
MVATAQEVLNITSGAFAEQGVTSGRKLSEGRTETGGCKPSVSGSFNLDNSHPDSLIYSGTITVDYSDGSSCPDSVKRQTGKIVDTFLYTLATKNGIRFTSSENISFQGYRKDTIALDGTFIVKSATKQPTTLESQNAKLTYLDGTAANWDGILTFTYDKGDSRDWEDNSVSVTGSLSGASREGAAFTAAIKKEIEYRYNCFKNKHKSFPVSGIIEVTTNGTLSTIDYGDGSCDKKYTIVTSGETTTLNLE